MSYQKTPLLNDYQRMQLDHWVEIYTQAHLAEMLEISFSTFLAAPQYYLCLAGQETAPIAIKSGHRPLLPAQVAASKRIWKTWADQEPFAPAAQITSAIPAIGERT